MSVLYVYDIETYPNVFTIVVKEHRTDRMWYYEISERKNQLVEILSLLEYIRLIGGRMVGFNNIDFDYPVIHNALLTRQSAAVTAPMIYKEVEKLFAPDVKWKSIREEEVKIPQVDLFRIWHFNNKAKSTSLKALEFWMRMDDIQDLPYTPGVPLTLDQIDPLIYYNVHDVKATEKFLDMSMDMIDFRDSLSDEYKVNFTNKNDVDVGTEVLAQRLNPNRAGRTRRSAIDLNEIIFPSVQLTTPEFKAIEKRMRGTKFNPNYAKGIFENLSATINGFQYDFGVGGIHGSVDSQVVRSDDDLVIVDLDVASYYPNLATCNNVFPEHVGPEFIAAYKDMYEVRKKYPKDHPLNKAMKLALNGSFGKTNSEYSWLYDPKYTFTITVNGQLLLAMFCEWCLDIPSLSMIQANTDGVTVRLPRANKPILDATVKRWMDHTGLVLEEAIYDRMFIRDCNNYIAQGIDGKVKRKGAYEYKVAPHQDPSALVVPKCAEKCLLDGVIPAMAVWKHEDAMDFMIRAKIRRSDRLVSESGKEYSQRINRFVASYDGEKHFVVSQPTGEIGQFKRKSGLSDIEFNRINDSIPKGTWDERIHTNNKSVYTEVKKVIAGGYELTCCNTIDGTIDRAKINMHYYIKEVEKLVNPILNRG